MPCDLTFVLMRKNNKEAITGPGSPGLPGPGRSNSFILLFFLETQIDFNGEK